MSAKAIVFWSELNAKLATFIEDNDWPTGWVFQFTPSYFCIFSLFYVSNIKAVVLSLLSTAFMICVLDAIVFGIILLYMIVSWLFFIANIPVPS